LAALAQAITILEQAPDFGERAVKAYVEEREQMRRRHQTE
jgi:hypothetical protein